MLLAPGGSSETSALGYAGSAAGIYIYTHPQVRRPLSPQPRNREAKPYQISQFLGMVREFGLTIEHRQ